MALCLGLLPNAFALEYDLEGLDKNSSTNWTPNGPWARQNLQDWKEMDFIPARVALTGGAENDQFVIVFPHYNGNLYGFQNLYFISNSPNVSITAAPVLTSPVLGDWSYTLAVRKSNASVGYVYFYARLAAGSRDYGGSSLHLDGNELSPLQIHKINPGPGRPDLAITKTAPAIAEPGEIITYTITYTNKVSGTNNAAHGVQIIDALPPLVTFVSASSGGSIAGNTLSFDLPDLPNRASGVVTYQVRVSPTALHGQTFTNNAVILEGEDDANMADNRASVMTTVRANLPPVANPDSYTVNEDTVLNPAAPGVLANDTDPEGKPLTAQLVTTTTNGTLTLNVNGSFIYTPNPNFNGTDQFTYKASDGTNLSGTVAVNITVLPVNDRPLANDDVYTVNEDTPLTIGAPGVLGNDFDIDGDPLSTVGATSPAHGTVVLNPNGSFTYQPAPNYNGPDSFTYRASDGRATSGVATVSITVNPVNDPPLANNDAYTLMADTVLNVSAPGVLANDTDIENDPLTAILPTNPAHGTLAFRPDGSFTYQPNTNFSGSDSFTYRVFDGRATSSVATVSLTINPVPIGIVNPPGNRTNCPGETAMFSVGATGTALTYQWYFGTTRLDNETGSTLVLQDLLAMDAGTYCVVVNGAAGNPVTNCALLVINQPTTVTTPPVNRTVCQNDTATFHVEASGTALTYQWFFGPNTLPLRTNSTLVLSNVALNAAGTYTVIVSGRCGAPITNSATLTVNENVAISVPPASQTSFVGSNVTFAVGATGTGLRYRWFFNGALLGTNSTLTLNNLLTNQAGLYCVVVSGVCGQPLTNCATLNFMNRPPGVNNDSYTTTEDTPLLVGAPGVLGNDSDPDEDTLTAMVFSGPSHGTLSLNLNGSFTYTPSLNYTGVDTFTYRASDSRLQSGVASVTITVIPVNDAPVANDDSYTTAEDTPLVVTASGILSNDTDVDGDTLRALLVSGTTHGTLSLSNNGAFVYVPSLNYTGVDTFTYRATDGQAFSAAATVTITVTPVNDRPVANNDAYTTAEDTPLNINAPGVLANDTDVDGDPLSAVLASGTTHGTLSLKANGSFTYSPALNYNGTDAFTYYATDGALTSTVATVTITVTPVNDPPVTGIDGDHYTVLEDHTLTVNAPGVLANDSDVDGDPLTAILISGVAHGTLALNANGSLTYTPAPDYFGNDSFVYVANDGKTSSAPATVTIQIVSVNDAPAFTGDGDVKVNENDGAQTLVWARNIRPGPTNESEQGVMFLVANDDNRLFTVPPNIAMDGTLTFTPAPDVFGVATVHVRLHDNGGTANGGGDTSEETIFHIAINSPPTVTLVAPENGIALIAPATFSVIASASDPDGTVTNVAFLVNGTLRTNVSTSPFYFIMSNTALGTYQFRAIALDNCGLSATSAPVTMEVVTNAVAAVGPIVLNRQNGLFEQFITVSNRSTETWAAGARLLVKLPAIDTTNKVWNPTGTDAGIPCIDKTNAVPPGGMIMFMVQYYVPNVRSVPNPSLLAVPLPFERTQTPPRILDIQCLAEKNFALDFTSQAGRFYFLQYSDDLVHWTTESGAMKATGPIYKAPQTSSEHKRFYRLLLVP